MMSKHHNNLIVIDFDHTIFDTSKFVAAWKAYYMHNFNIPEEEFDAARESTKHINMVIDIDNFIDMLSYPDKHALHEAVHQLIKKEMNTCIFPDVQPFLENHHDQYDLLISTHGDQELQAEKIRHAGLPSYVGIEISTKPKSEVLTPYVKAYKQVYLIEDKATNIDDVKEKHPNVFAYHLKRPEDCKYCHVVAKCACVNLVIKNLDFVIES